MTEARLTSLTLDRRIRAEVEGRIRSGDWRPGDRIPTERDLMTAYGCARMTVSKAMEGLVRSGLIERRKKAGSFVARPHVQTAVLEIPDIPALIAARGESYRFQRASRLLRPLDPDDDGEAALAASAPVLAIGGLHIADGAPFALESRVINVEAVPLAREQTFDEEPPGSWLLRHVPWTQARHRIAAVNADAEAARQLGLRQGAACLQVERHTFRAEEWITFARMVFPGDRYDLTAAFGPTSP